MAAAVGFLILVSWMVTRERGRRPRLLAGWLWYGVTLLPVIGLVQAGTQSHADRFTYIPLIGIFFMIAGSIPAGRARRWLPAAAAITAVASLAVLSVFQVGYWRDERTLFSRVAAVTGGNALAEVHLGADLLRRGEAEKALTHYRRALRINGDDAPLHYDVAVKLVSLGRDEEARELLRRTLVLAPDYVLAHFSLALLELRQGNDPEALLHLGEAVRYDPSFAEGHAQLGAALARLGSLEEAWSHLDLSSRLRPGDARLHYNLGAVLEGLGRSEAAREEYLRAARIDPSLAGTPGPARRPR